MPLATTAPTPTTCLSTGCTPPGELLSKSVAVVAHPEAGVGLAASSGSSKRCALWSWLLLHCRIMPKSETCCRVSEICFGWVFPVLPAVSTALSISCVWSLPGPLSSSVGHSLAALACRRYRTQLCNDGSNCKRKICFFAHSLDELRVPACKPFVSPEALAAAAAAAASDEAAKRKAGGAAPLLGGLGDVLAAQQVRISV